MTRTGAVLALTLFITQAAFAQSARQLHNALAAESARLHAWTADEILVNAVRRQNASKMTLAEVVAVDAEWVAGRQKALKKSITVSPCADRLRRMSIDGLHGEAFVTDANGALVCSTAVTSDYWQGDEPKFTNAFKKGAGSVFIDRPRFDESAAATLAQISVPVMDNGRAIGVLVVGVAAPKMARR